MWKHPPAAQRGRRGEETSADTLRRQKDSTARKSKSSVLAKILETLIEI